MVRMVRSIVVASLLPLPPLHARATGGPAAPELVAEALFLRDDLPPGGRDLSLSVVLERSGPDETTGEAPLTASPRLQLAMALGRRVGFTADAGLAPGGGGVDAPGASLKVLLRAPGAGAPGIAASLDVLGSTTSIGELEAGLGVGAIRSFGRVTLRAAAGLASAVSGWSPHLHGGVSAAVGLGSRWRVLGEVVVDGAGGEVAAGAAPTVKVTLTEKTALMAGALLRFDPAAARTLAVQLTTSL